MKIAIGGDHASFDLKYPIYEHLVEKGYEVTDFGAFRGERVDYPAVGEAVAKAVAAGEYDFGIVICGTGIGISIAANKVRGARAALCTDCFMAEMTRRHNDANILALGARVLGHGLALKIVETFLDTEFEGGRHARRVDIISAIEERSR